MFLEWKEDILLDLNVVKRESLQVEEIMLKPFPIPNRLFSSKGAKPEYGKSCKLKSGQVLTLCDPKATRALISLMDMQATLGGAASHFGGPSAFAELMSALFGYMFYISGKEGVEWFDRFHFVNDAGHCENGLYALKANYRVASLNKEALKGFRSINSVLTGHGESHLFPEGVYLSNGPLGSAFPQSQGLALSDALSGKKRTTITSISDGACMEGETKEALASIPGFASKNKMAPYVLIISDNNTKLSGRIDEESFSMGPTFKSLSHLGWKVFSLPKGHDLQKCLLVIEDAISTAEKDPKIPVVIHAKTIKGYGVKKIEDSSSGGHGFPLKDTQKLQDFLEEIYQEEKLPSEFLRWCEDLKREEKEKNKGSSPGQEKQKVQVGVSEALIDKKKEGIPIISVSSDLSGSTGVQGFRKQFPESSIDVGVAESNMISISAGLSKKGFVPIVDTFAQFGVTKGSLPLTMASLSECPMICVFSHTGFQDAADGASHQALSFIAMVSSIPNVVTYCLSTKEEAKALISQAVEEFSSYRKRGEVPITSIFFLGRETFPTSIYSGKYQLGKAQVVLEEEGFEKSITLVSAGPLIHECLKVAKNLKEKNIGCYVVNASCINRPDIGTVKDCLEKTKGRLFVVEDHQQKGGLGSLLCHSLTLEGVSFQMRGAWVSGQFGRSAYTAKDLYQHFCLDEKKVTETILKWL